MDFGDMRARARVSPFTHNNSRHVCARVYVRPESPRLPRPFLCPALFLLASNETFRAPPACLEPFTPCWVSHRNLLRPHFHPRGSRRRENPSDLSWCRKSRRDMVPPRLRFSCSTLSPIVSRRARWRDNPSSN